MRVKDVASMYVANNLGPRAMGISRSLFWYVLREGNVPAYIIEDSSGGVRLPSNSQ